jgi:thiol-disulfide isomerase/thioredoxin
LSRSQDQVSKAFHIYGWIKDVNIGTVVLYYDKGNPYNYISQDTVETMDGRFHFSGKIPYPQEMNIRFINHKIERYSQSFFVDSGNQVLYAAINSDTFSYKHPWVTGSVLHDEFNIKFEKFRYRVVSKYDSLMDRRSEWYDKTNGNIPERIQKNFDKQLMEINNEYDSLLLSYIKENPGSYVGLWMLKNYSFQRGYNNWYQKCFESLDDNLRSTCTGNEIKQFLVETRKTAVGEIFPTIKVVVNGKNKDINFAELNKKYILVDFWFSHCAPCISQFQGLVRLHNSYRNKGFQIIGISIDEIKNLPHWLTVIKQYKLNWPQWWDRDGKTATFLRISSFPSNFLLDQNGRIIAKNIEPSQIILFIKK